MFGPLILFNGRIYFFLHRSARSSGRFSARVFIHRSPITFTGWKNLSYYHCSGMSFASYFLVSSDKVWCWYSFLWISTRCCGCTYDVGMVRIIPCSLYSYWNCMSTKRVCFLFFFADRKSLNSRNANNIKCMSKSKLACSKWWNKNDLKKNKKTMEYRANTNSRRICRIIKKELQIKNLIFVSSLCVYVCVRECVCVCVFFENLETENMMRWLLHVYV